MWQNHPFSETKTSEENVERTATSWNQKSEPSENTTGIIQWWKQASENSHSESFRIDKKERNREKFFLSLKKKEANFFLFSWSKSLCYFYWLNKSICFHYWLFSFILFVSNYLCLFSFHQIFDFWFYPFRLSQIYNLLKTTTPIKNCFRFLKGKILFK